MADESTSPAFEQNLDALEGVVKRLEAGDLPLEEALALFERGMTLSDACRKQIEEAETRVEVLMKRGRQVRAEPMPEEE
ncbi:MAG: exodeoxyribonuclease VII small subunit [Bryobacteraceae bacterium]